LQLNENEPSKAFAEQYIKQAAGFLETVNAKREELVKS